jgi:hypothetical protein
VALSYCESSDGEALEALKLGNCELSDGEALEHW